MVRLTHIGFGHTQRKPKFGLDGLTSRMLQPVDFVRAGTKPHRLKACATLGLTLRRGRDMDVPILITNEQLR
jgi:hypothetical protein